jgi:hypothetical protein
VSTALASFADSPQHPDRSGFVRTLINKGFGL